METATRTKIISNADFIDFYSGSPVDLTFSDKTTYTEATELIPRKSVPTTSLSDVADVAKNETEVVDWAEYSPPVALRWTDNVESEVLLRLINESLDTLQAQNAAENERKRRRLEQESERRKREAEEAAVEAIKTKRSELFLPIIIPPEIVQPVTMGEVDALLQAQQLLDAEITAAFLATPVAAVKPRKNRLFNFKKVLKKLQSKENTHLGDRLAADVYTHRKRVGSSTGLTPRRSDGTLDSQTNSAPIPEPAPIEEVECVSCLDDFLVTDVIKVTCHSYCQDCFERLVTSACHNEQHWPPKCCLNNVPVRTVRAHVSAATRSIFDERSAEWSIPIAERMYCSHQDCSLFIPASGIELATRTAQCTLGHLTCTLCHGESHPGTECPQDADFRLTEALAEEEGWLHCGQCRALVEHREACQHMTCLCGYQFCYVCNAQWKTCRCTMTDLTRKKDSVQDRRVRRQEREAREEAELQEALRLIEEFEREEALKAELLRQEMERLEAERREQELKERIRREAIRRREVEARFTELRVALSSLHNMQRQLMADHRNTDAELLREESEAAKSRLEGKQAEDKAELDTKMIIKLATKEAVFQKEYAARVADEQRVEDTYLQQLSEYYGGRRDSEECITGAMTTLRKGMDKAWRDWQRWRDQELAVYRIRVEDERTIKDELMYSAKLRLDEELETRANELRRSQAAGLEWIEHASREREAMLDRLEAEELDNGDDVASLLEELDTDSESGQP